MNEFDFHVGITTTKKIRIRTEMSREEIEAMSDSELFNTFSNDIASDLLLHLMSLDDNDMEIEQIDEVTSKEEERRVEDWTDEELSEFLYYYAQNEEMVDQSFTETGRIFIEASRRLGKEDA